MTYKENLDREYISTSGLYGDGFFGDKDEKYSKDDYRYMLYTIYLDTENYTKTLGEVRPMFYELTDYFDKKLDYIEMSFLTEPMTQDDIDYYNELNGSGTFPLYIMTMLAKHDGEYTFGKTSLLTLYTQQERGYIGRFFTDEEVQNGDAVCIANVDRMKNQQVETAKVSLREDGEDAYVTICGTEYKVIGQGTNGLIGGIYIPFENSPDELYVDYAMFVKFNEPLTVEENNKYVSIMNKYLGDMLVNDLDVAVVNVDKQTFYNTNIWLSVIIAFAAAINLAVLYRYVLTTRRKTLAIFRLTGATKNKIRRIYITETLGISVVIFAICTVIFNFAVLPWLTKYYPYCAEVYNLKIYGIMFLIYAAISYIVLNAMIIAQISRSPVELLREGT
ncbi:MAG: hypothetical protein LUC25_01380 [Ruminococcus sp.]|nr:hypothetical protein [Ruminococcus sp.]